jgi:aminoglycoside 2'-N-acetyltransferase I
VTPELRTARTSGLDSAVLQTARALLYEVLEKMTEHDWDHARGGLHALVWDGDELIGHASVVERRLVHDGRALRAGYVEGLGVRADRRREGHGAAMMEALERVIRDEYDLGALSATDEGASLYASRGWSLWKGPTAVLTPTGIKRTKDDDGSVYVLPVIISLDLSGDLVCDWRDGDVW